jgi:hypothetical protein
MPMFRFGLRLLFVAAFLAGQLGTQQHYGECPMAAASESADTPAQPGHDHHPTDASPQDDAGCDCKASHCCPPVGLVQPAAGGRALTASLVGEIGFAGLATEKIPSPAARGTVAARAPPSLL